MTRLPAATKWTILLEICFCLPLDGIIEGTLRLEERACDDAAAGVALPFLRLCCGKLLLNFCRLPRHVALSLIPENRLTRCFTRCFGHTAAVPWLERGDELGATPCQRPAQQHRG